MTTEGERGRDDVWTVVAIAVIVCASASVIHEGLGHGGMCVLTGGHAKLLSSVEFVCDRDTRWISAGGTIANFVAGAVFWAAARAVVRSARWRFFFWLAMTVNLLQAGGYFLYSGVGNIGDWAAVVAGWSPGWAWRTGLVVIGVGLYAAFVWIALRELRPLVGEGGERWRVARKLCLIPYFTIGILSCVAGALNPTGMMLVAISAAAASFGGTSGLAWMWQLLRGPQRGQGRAALPPIGRSTGWMVAGAMVGAVFIGVLGRGIRFG